MFKRKWLYLFLTIIFTIMSFIPAFADAEGSENMSFDLFGQEAYGCYYHVAGLSYGWNAQNYNALVITDGSTTDGSTTDPDGNWYVVENPGISGSARYIDGWVDLDTPETRYTLRAYLMLANGVWKYAGVDNIKTTPEYVPEEPYCDSVTLVGQNSCKVDFIIGYDCPYTEFYWNTSGAIPDYWASYDDRTTSGTNTTMGTITLYNLPYNDDVWIYMRSRDSSGVCSGWVLADMVSTLSPLPPSPPIITNRFDGGVDIQCGLVSRATTYYFEYRKLGASSWIQIPSSSVYATITGLQYSTVYEFRVKTDLIETYSGINSGTTTPKQPTLSAGVATYNSIAVQVGALPDYCDKVKVECYEINGTYVTTNWINPSGRTFSTAQNTTFNGLNRNYSYYFIAISCYDAGGDGTGTGTWLESTPSTSLTVTTLNRPDNWAWSYNITPGGNVYQSSYNTTTGVLTAYIMPVEEWWNFQIRINDFRTYMGLSDYLFIDVTHNSGCTPEVINDAIDAINPMLSTANQIPHVSAGNVPASVFTTMRDRLNAL